MFWSYAFFNLVKLGFEFHMVNVNIKNVYGTNKPIIQYFTRIIKIFFYTGNMETHCNC